MILTEQEDRELVSSSENLERVYAKLLELVLHVDAFTGGQIMSILDQLNEPCYFLKSSKSSRVIDLTEELAAKMQLEAESIVVKALKR